jgi:hypothetical protein
LWFKLSLLWLLFRAMAQVLQNFLALCEATQDFLKREDLTAENIQDNVDNISQGLERLRGRAESCSPQVVKAINALPLRAESRQFLITKSSQIASESVALSSKSAFQDWSSICLYITADFAEQTRILGNDSERLRKLVLFAHQLGLKYPSESTFQAITALHLSFCGLAGLDSAQKKLMNDNVKADFRRFSAIDSAEQFMQKLPLAPEDLKRRRPAFFQRHFGESPVFVTIDTAQWNLVLSFRLHFICIVFEPTVPGLWPYFSV